MGLFLNPAKTIFFGWRSSSAAIMYDLPSITVAGTPVHPTPINSPIRYLGIDFFINKRPIVHSQHAEDDLILIESSSLKPFQKLRCINTLIMPKYLYAASAILGSSGDSAAIDKALRIRIKTLLHLPLSFPNTHMHLASRDGGLGCLNIERVAQEVQLKALARLVRLGNRAVDHLLNTTVGPYHCRLASQLRVPPDLTDAKELAAALGQSRKEWWRDTQAAYRNRDLFAHHDQALGNSWLQHDSRHLKDGDRIKALRLRTNTYPTNALLHLHDSDPSARLCRRYHQSLETPFHILQECPSIKLPRMERHNFICKQVCRLVSKHNPEAVIRTEQFITSPDGIRLRPDIIISDGDRVIIADVAVSWDDRPHSLQRMCDSKSAKYDCLRPLYPDKVVTAVGLAFGARSMLCMGTVRGGASLGIPKWDMAWLASRALVGSLICLNRFMKA